MTNNKLSKYITKKEFEYSKTALKINVDNTMPELHRESAEKLCQNVIDPVREHFGKPAIVTSGYRCDELNRAIGGKAGSYHRWGEAIDFYIKGVDNKIVCLYIVENLDFDQLILEFYKGGNTGWIHCSYKNRSENNRKQVLHTKRIDGRIKYLEGLG